MIDEYPILAVAAAFASGDRGCAACMNYGQGIRSPRRGRRRLARAGVETQIIGDDLIVEGRGESRGGGEVRRIWTIALR